MTNPSTVPGAAEPISEKEKDGDVLSSDSLCGQLLLAMPGDKGGIFERSVVYLFAHSIQGAMGLILNTLIEDFSLQDLLLQLNLIKQEEANFTNFNLAKIPVHRGGPVETSRGFVLHTKSYYSDSSTLLGKNGICLTATSDVLRIMARERDPSGQALLALGYAGWAAGQLENEIQSNIWLVCPADLNLVFECPLEEKYERALQKIGVQAEFLSDQPGHA